MKKIMTYFITGLVLLITGIIIAKFGPHRHMSKGMLLAIPGFILSGASGITLLQIRKQKPKKKDREDILDSE